MRYPVLVALGVSLLSCGGAKVTVSEETRQREAAVPPAECETFDARVATCVDAFEAAYARTELAGLGRDGDGAAGAAAVATSLRADHMGRDSMVAHLCDNAWSISSWTADRREQWHRCFEESTCEAWAECFAPLVGRGWSDPAP